MNGGTTYPSDADCAASGCTVRREPGPGVVRNGSDPADNSAFPPVKYSNYAAYVGRRYDVVARDARGSASLVADDGRCRTAARRSASAAPLVTGRRPDRR